MSWVEIVSALLGLSCVFLAGRGSKYNFWVGYAYNIFLFILFWNQHLYSAMILQPVSFAINLYGHWRWTHPKEEERSAADATALKVGSLGPKGWVASVAVVAAAGALWALCLQWLPQRWPDVRGRPFALAGLLCADGHPPRTVPQRPQVLGVLDCLAGGKLRQHSAVHSLGTLSDAACQRALPCQRHLVAGQLAEETLKGRIGATSARGAWSGTP